MQKPCCNLISSSGSSETAGQNSIWGILLKKNFLYKLFLIFKIFVHFTQFSEFKTGQIVGMKLIFPGNR
jgi:hypothetical protein